MCGCMYAWNQPRRAQASPGRSGVRKGNAQQQPQPELYHQGWTGLQTQVLRFGIFNTNYVRKEQELANN